MNINLEEQFRKIFNKFDDNKTGTINSKKYIRFLKIIKIDVKNKDVIEFFEKEDSNKDFLTDYEDFYIYFKKNLKEFEKIYYGNEKYEEEKKNEIRFYFEKFDFDKKGFLDFEKFKKIINEKNNEMKEKKIFEFFNKINKKKN